MKKWSINIWIKSKYTEIRAWDYRKMLEDSTAHAQIIAQ